MTANFDVIVVGAGQAGLAMGFYLREMGLNFLLVDGAPQAGHSWRQRWDSLMLFTPARFSSLPGWPMPEPETKRPTKDHVADYLAAYVAHFDLPVRWGELVTHLSAHDQGYSLTLSGGATLTARQVVIATGPHPVPKVPRFADALSDEVFQLHSRDYRHPQQLPPGDVLVVGGANSGAQIAEELSQTRRVTVARRPLGTIPGLFLEEWAWALVDRFYMPINTDTALGRMLSRRQEPVFGVNLGQLARQRDLTLKPKASAAEGAEVRFADGSAQRVTNVIWATGYRHDFSWVALNVFDDAGRPCHHRGVTSAPGLYFLGLEWLYTRGSALIGWVERDAAYLVEQIITQRT